MKENKKILELTIIERNKEIEFCIDTDVPLTENECNEIIKIYASAYARKFKIKKQGIEKIKPCKFEEVKYDN